MGGTVMEAIKVIPHGERNNHCIQHVDGSISM